MSQLKNQSEPQSKLQQQLKALLNDKEFIDRIEILDKQITQKESTVTRLNSDIKNLENRAESASEATDAKIAQLREELEAKQDEITLLKKTYSNVQEDIKKAKESLKSIREEISTQTTYFNSEQVKINEIVNNWNDQLRAFQEADNEVKVKKESVNRDIVRLEQDKIALQDDVKTIESKSVELDEQYKIKASGYKEELNIIKADIEKAKQALYELELKNEARIRALDTREQSLLTRERTLQQNELNLSSREKKLNMKLSNSMNCSPFKVSPSSLLSISSSIRYRPGWYSQPVLRE